MGLDRMEHSGKRPENTGVENEQDTSMSDEWAILERIARPEKQNLAGINTWKERKEANKKQPEDGVGAK